MGNKHNILLIEDDNNLGYILSEYLRIKGFTVHWARNGNSALSALRTSPFDVCLIDVMLPDTDGFSVAEQINQMSIQVPFIFLTAKSLKVDKLKGFKLGCDDYITKPVDEEELVARIQVVVRRNTAGANPSAKQPLQFGNSTFNFASRSLRIHNTELMLTAKEAEVLYLLIHSRNTLLPRDVVLKKIWGTNDYFNRRSMDVIISRLRKHLAKDEGITIVIVHSKGYMLKEL